MWWLLFVNTFIHSLPFYHLNSIQSQIEHKEVSFHHAVQERLVDVVVLGDDDKEKK